MEEQLESVAWSVERFLGEISSLNPRVCITKYLYVKVLTLKLINFLSTELKNIRLLF
jgi:hypothetical protein